MRTLLSSLLLMAILLPGLFAQGPALRTRASQTTTRVSENMEPPSQASANPNVLTPQEQESGWKLLFDGKSFEGWRSFRKAAVVADRWTVEDGCLHLMKRSAERRNGGDLITTETFSNFEFAFEWLAAGGVNSGVKYLIDEYFAPNRAPVSFEYQIEVEEDATKPRRKPVHSTGALYDMMPPAGGVIRPGGMFNESRVVVRGMHVEHWLNGEKVLEFDRGAPPFRELVAKSKFWKWPGFGLNARGHIGLQDHGAEIWFRRIRVRPLSVTSGPLTTSASSDARPVAATP